MLMLDFLAEQRIAEAVSRGELDHLPAGPASRPRRRSLMPRTARRLPHSEKWRLRAGGGPDAHEIAQLERFVPQMPGTMPAARAKALKKLALLRTRIERQILRTGF